MHTRFIPVILCLAPSFVAASVVPVNSTAPAPSDTCQPQLNSSAVSNPIQTAATCNALGLLDLRAGDSKAGEAKIRYAVSLAIEALGESDPDVALYQANLALALGVQGKIGRAEVLLNRARYIVDMTLPSTDTRLATVLTEMSAVETAEKHFARAEADARQSLAIVAGLNAPDSLDVAVQQIVLATIYLREHKPAEAGKLLPAAVAVERRLAADAGFDRRILAHAIHTLGELRALENNWHEAQALYSEAISIYDSTPAANRSTMAQVLIEYASILKHCGVPKEQVKNVESRAREMKTMKA